MAMPQMPKWYDDDGQIVSCTEKVKVMTENLNELYQIAQDAFEDALLMVAPKNSCANTSAT